MNRHKVPEISRDLSKRIKLVRRDVSNLLFHFTRTPEENNIKVIIGNGILHMSASAHSILTKILYEGKLKGASKWTNGENCICFTEAPIVELNSIFSLVEIASSQEQRPRYEPYGIAVSKKWLFSKGCRPVIYDHPEIFDSLPQGLKYRFVPYNPEEGIDFTWEREWRIKTDFLQLDHKHTLVVVPTANEAFDFVYQFANIEPNTVNVDYSGPVVEDFCHDPRWLAVSLDLFGFDYYPNR